jgi:hypothetical protein
MCRIEGRRRSRSKFGESSFKVNTDARPCGDEGSGFFSEKSPVAWLA